MHKCVIWIVNCLTCFPGLFIYTSGCVVIVEDLNTSSQQYLQGKFSNFENTVL